ncbi:MAG: hypothetical protein ABIH49_00520 [archaeon]
MVKKNIFLILAVAFVIIIAIGFVYYNFYSKEDKNFYVDHIFLKSVVKQNEDLTTSFKVINLNEAKDFTVEIIDLENLIFVGEKSFHLEIDESAEVKAIFNNTNIMPDVYVGSLKISGISEEIIPVILEIQSKDPIFAINLDVSPKYKEVNRNGEITAGINFFNIKDTRNHQIEIVYKILNTKGEIINSETNTISVGSKSSVTKTIPIPKNTPSGNYVFAVVAKSEDRTSTSSYLFSVVERRIIPPLSEMNFFTLMVAVFLLIMVIIIIYIVNERNKLFTELKRQHSSEIKFYSENIDQQKRELLRKAKTEKQKKIILAEFRGAKDKVINEIKKQQKEQRSELRKIKNKKNRKTVEKKLRKWRREIYPKALKSAEISRELKLKLGALKEAYSEGYISRDSYKKGSSRIQSATRKIKRKSL